MNDIEKYYKKYNDIENQIQVNSNINKNEILSNLKDDLDNINLNKELVNKSKSLMIKINKSKNFLDNKQKLEKNINLKIKNLNYESKNTIPQIIDKYKSYFTIDHNELNLKLEKIIEQSDIFTYLDFYSIINYKKEKKNNLHKLICSIHSNNSNELYPKIIFLENFKLLYTQENISQFISKFDFKFSKESSKMLKRGFLFEVSKNNSIYIVKYQPNKSFMEILINKYISKNKQLNNLVLYPEYFFVNKNNSYFYIIQKYDTDLFTYIKKKKKPLDDNEIIFIIKFLIKIIYELHKMNIIYADVKLENFVVNIEDNKIKDIKLIDFDVTLFDELPNEFLSFDYKIQTLLDNKKPRGTKLYMASNSTMSKSNDIYSIGTFIIILLYKNIMKIINCNKKNISDNLLSKILNRLSNLKNKMEHDDYKKKLIKYIFRIYNDKRFKHHWNNKIHFKTIYNTVKDCINQDTEINTLHNNFN